MSVSIQFPAEIERALLQKAEAAGQDIETFVVNLLSDRLEEENNLPVGSPSHDEFMTRLHEIIDLHPTSNGSVDDSRESIYAGRGE